MSHATDVAQQGRLPVTRSSRFTLWRNVKRHRWHYVFLAPMVILFLMFTVWPMVASWVYAFFDWDGYGPLQNFVGMDNFTEAIQDPQFWSAFRHTFVFTAGAVFIQMPLALIFALILNNAFLAGRNLYRIGIFLPVVTTTAVVGVVFAVLLDPNGGAINELLLNLGLVDAPVNFLGSKTLALPTVVLVDVWKGLGVTMIYWLAALQTIPQQLYEVAKIDGASRWQQLRYVTLPLLVPIGMIILLLTVVSSFHAFDLVQTMTGGGPNWASDIIDTYIYRNAFNPEQFLPRFGFASAAAVFFGLTVLLITAVQAILMRRYRGRIGGAGG